MKYNYLINKNIAILFCLLFLVPLAWGQKQKAYNRPKLVVGIVVDQMRFDYLTRFYGRYSNGGFRRLMHDGYECRNNHYNYIPTYTGPGHASIFTGTTPKNHGIISNNWYDKFSGKNVYCASDPNVKPVGTNSPLEKMSPHRMLTTTLGDQNRLFTQMRGKTIGIAIKDRGAILPAGHSANAAYWFRGKDDGQWVTTNYYRNELPDWVKNFNRKRVKKYLQKWEPLYPIKSYTQSGGDLTDFDNGYEGKSEATFPYDLPALANKNEGFDIIKASPFGNTMTADFAMEAIINEELGKDEDTDVLTISFSSTDYVGHNFGVNSTEIEDTYLRLDQDIERLLNFLDKEVGQNEYTLFLTADHGAIHVPSYLKSVKIPAGYFEPKAFTEDLVAQVKNQFKTDSLIRNISNYQIFLNYKTLQENSIQSADVQNFIEQYLLAYEKIDRVFTRRQLEQANYTEGIPAKIENGFHQKRSGDILFVLDPGYIIYSLKGSTHGSGAPYDTHIPLLFYGKGIKKGYTHRETSVIDVVPTISSMLGIGFPNGSTGNVLYYLLEKE